METLIARSEDERQHAFDRLSAAKVLGCDTETSGLDPKRAELFSLQFSDGDCSVLVPLSEGVKMGKLAGILADNSIRKIFHNARFDINFLTENGYETQNIYDTMIAEKVLTKGANQSVSLAETLYRYFAIDLDKDQRKKFGRSWDRQWTGELVEYALNDVAYLPKLMTEQLDWMEKLNLREEYEAQAKKLLEGLKNRS